MQSGTKLLLTETKLSFLFSMGVIDLGELSDCHCLNLETASIDKWIFLHQNNSVSILECLALFLLLYF